MRRRAKATALLASLGLAALVVPGLVGLAPATPGPPSPLVLVVHTHRNEGYDPAACLGADRFAPGPADVVRAGRLLTEELRAQGVPAWHDEAFGTDSAPGAYARVRPRLRVLLRAHPDVGLVLDLHRDDLDHARATAVARGYPATRLLLVVGSRPRSSGFDWRRNLELAVAFADRLRVRAPGLDRGIWVKPGDYAQDLGPPSALLEVGGRGSCPAEVARSLVLVARLVSELLSGQRAAARAASPSRP